MIKRLPADICLLCRQNPSNQKGSHYTPASIIKKVIGERDYEEAYSINANDATTSTYLGRSNLKNTDPTIRKAEHVEDYIFCSACETRLGIIEGLCGQPLNKLVDDLAKGGVTVHKTADQNKYTILAKLHKNTLIVYFYSIIWRQCLQQYIDQETIVLPQTFQDQLRDIVYAEIYKEKAGIEEADFNSYPPLTILTTYHKGDLTTCFINPNPSQSNPELFFIGPYEVLIWHDGFETPYFPTTTTLDNTIKEVELRISSVNEARICVLNQKAWRKTIERLANNEANKYITTVAGRLRRATNLSPAYARRLVLSVARDFYVCDGGNYITQLHRASEHLLGYRA